MVNRHVNGPRGVVMWLFWWISAYFIAQMCILGHHDLGFRGIVIDISVSS
jgi:hypothetical protein